MISGFDAKRRNGEFVRFVSFESTDRNYGEMPEWSIGAVSKTVDPLWGSQGSNPCLSATLSL